MGGDPIRLRAAAQLPFACQRRLVDTGSSWDLGAKLQPVSLCPLGLGDWLVTVQVTDSDGATALCLSVVFRVENQISTRPSWVRSWLQSACSPGVITASQVCQGGVCQAPSCSDGVQNGLETGTDCGGPCPACPVVCNEQNYQAERRQPGNPRHLRQ